MTWQFNIKCWTCDDKVDGLTPCQDAIKCLLLTWVNVGGQVNHLDI